MIFMKLTMIFDQVNVPVIAIINLSKISES